MIDRNSGLSNCNQIVDSAAVLINMIISEGSEVDPRLLAQIGFIPRELTKVNVAFCHVACLTTRLQYRFLCVRVCMRGVVRDTEHLQCIAVCIYLSFVGF